MAKKTNNYFELIKKQSSYCVQAASLLEEIITRFTPDSIGAYREQMHAIEHTADGVHHSILNSLSTEFITPIDQEDILRLVQIIDDITDAIDEVILDIYMYRVEHIPSGTAALAGAVTRCVCALDEAASELKSFKKPDTLRARLVKVNDIEGEADELYSQAIYELFGTQSDAKTLIASHAIYEGLEDCCDLCEHAADVIEQVIIKNT